MKKRFFGPLLALVLAAFVQVSSAQTEWVKVSPEGGNFSVLMPVQPKSDKQTVPMSNIGPYTTHLFSASHEGVIYMAGWAEYQPSLKLNVQAEIDANRDNFIKGVNGKLASQEKIVFAGHQGLDFKVEIPPDLVAASKVFVVGNRPYQLIVIARTSIDPAKAAKFFTSFKFNSQK